MRQELGSTKALTYASMCAAILNKIAGYCLTLAMRCLSGDVSRWMSTCVWVRGRKPQVLHCRLLSRGIDNWAWVRADSPLPTTCSKDSVSTCHAGAKMHAQMTAAAMARQTDTQRLAKLTAVEMNFYICNGRTCCTAGMADLQHTGLAMG